MKHFKRYVAFILALILTFQVDIGITNAKETEIPEMHTADKIRDMYNMAVPIRFDGEDEYVNDQIPEANNITNIQLIDDTYNNSIYSVQEYYKAVSNHTLNLKTVYLTEGEDGFTSIKLNHSRGYYSPKTEQNPEGYTTEGELRKRDLLLDWTEKVTEAIDNGAKLKNIAGEEIDFAKLDSDGDRSIDSITLLFTPSDAKYAAEWNSPLWAYQTDNYLLNIETSKGTLTSKRYYQASIQNAPSGIYKEVERDVFFFNTSTVIHEMGHIFGLLDLYPFSGDSKPMYYMSAMAKALSPVVQFMTSREREAAGWLTAENVTPITKAGTYTLPPVQDVKQTGTVAYTLELPNEKRLYLEYRYVEDQEVNRFDFNSAKRQLYNSLGSSVKAVGLNKSGLLICDADISRKFPSNSSGIPQLSAIGGKYATKIDAPRAKGESITYGGYTISITDLTKDKITFKVSGNGLEEEQRPEQPGNEGKPTANGVTLLAPSGIGEDLQLTATRGSQIQFLAQAEGKKFSDGDTLWSVKGGIAADTEIDVETGLLKIGAYESPTSVLKVVGKSDEDGTKSITINVKVTLGTKTYAVTYLPGNDSAGEIESAQKMHDVNLTLKGALYAKTGFIQTGWSLREGGEKVYDLNSELSKNSSVMLYPYWTKSIAFNPVVSPMPTVTSNPVVSPKPTVTSNPVVSPMPTVTSNPVVSPKPTVTSNPVVSPKPTATPNPPESSKPMVSPKPSIILSAKSMALDTGATKTGKITVRVVGSDKNVTFKSSNSKIVKVDQSGNLTALKAGKVDISASANGVKAICKVVVKTASVKMNSTSVVLYLPEIKPTKLSANVSGVSSKANFKSNNASIVKIGATGRLTAVKEGKTTVTATANGRTATCKVEVKKTSLTLNLSTSTIYLKGKNSIQLKPVIVGQSKKAIYKSSNTKVVKVSSTGKVIAVGKGTANITVTANGIEKKCKITVLSAKGTNNTR